MLKKLDIKLNISGSRPGIFGELADDSNAILNSEKIVDAELYSTNDTKIHYKDKENDSAMTLVLDDTLATVETFIDTSAGTKVLTVPVFDGNDPSESTSEKSLHIDKIQGAIAYSSSDTTKSFIAYDDSPIATSTYLVDMSLDEIEGYVTNKAIFTSFNFLADDNAALSVDVTGTIDTVAKTVALTVPAATDVTALVATFTTIKSGSVVKVSTTTQTSGTTDNDFTSPVTYGIYESTGTTKLVDYTVTVTVAS